MYVRGPTTRIRGGQLSVTLSDEVQNPYRLLSYFLTLHTTLIA